MFIDRERGAKASVILKLRRSSLPRDSVLAISRLVAGAVDELKPEDVSIIDADSERSFSIGQDSDTTSEGMEANLKQRLLSTLEPVVGADRIRASVNVDYDKSTTEENDEKYDPAVTALLNQQRSEDAASDAGGLGGIPGTGSNTPLKQAKSTPSTATQRSTSESSVYGVNKIQVHRTIPAGQVQRITTAILVDDMPLKKVVNGKETFTRVKRSQEELDKIQQLAQAAIGFDAKRGDTISVQNLPFDTSADITDLPQPSWIEKVQRSASDYSSILRPLSLLALFLLAYLFVVRPVQKHALAPGLVVEAARAELAATVSCSDNLIDSEDGDARRAAQLKQRTIELIKQKPSNTAGAVQAWLREDPS